MLDRWRVAEAGVKLFETSLDKDTCYMPFFKIKIYVHTYIFECLINVLMFSNISLVKLFNTNVKVSVIPSYLVKLESLKCAYNLLLYNSQNMIVKVDCPTIKKQ